MNKVSQLGDTEDRIGIISKETSLVMRWRQASSEIVD